MCVTGSRTNICLANLEKIYRAIIGPGNQEMRRLAERILDAVPEEDGL